MCDGEHKYLRENWKYFLFKLLQDPDNCFLFTIWLFICLAESEKKQVIYHKGANSISNIPQYRISADMNCLSTFLLNNSVHSVPHPSLLAVLPLHPYDILLLILLREKARPPVPTVTMAIARKSELTPSLTSSRFRLLLWFGDQCWRWIDSFRKRHSNSPSPNRRRSRSRERKKSRERRRSRSRERKRSKSKERRRSRSRDRGGRFRGRKSPL